MTGSIPVYGKVGSGQFSGGISNSGPIAMFTADLSTTLVLSSARCGARGVVHAVVGG